MAEKHNTTDNRRKLYDVLQQHVGNMGTWDEFNRRMDDEGNRRKVYEVAQQRVANIGTWDEFNARIYQTPAPAAPAPKQEPQNAATPAVEPQADAATPAATPAQPRWQPTEQDKIRMQWEMFQSMNGFKQRTKARLDQTRRMAERFTPEGRRKLKAAKFAAQAAGAPAKVMGITPPAQAPAGAQAGGQAGAPPVQSGESPVPYGVKYIDGKPVTEWLLPDGSLTTSLLEADQAEFGARKARLRHQFEKRMKSNGLNPANPDDVELQAQYDAQAPAYDVVADLWSEAEELHKKDRERNADRAWDSYAAMGGGRELRVVTASMNRHADNISHLTRFDLQKMMDKAWERVGPQIYANCYSRLKQQYPGASAQDLHKTATEMARSLSDNAVYQYAVDKNTPKSTMEFFGRTVADMNLINSLGKALARSQAGTSGDMAAAYAAMSEYGKHHRIAQVGGTVVGMAIDPVTWISGGVGSAAGKGALWTGGRIMARFTGTSGQVATRYLGTTLSGRLLGGLAGGAANLGTYEALKEGERQLKYGGYINPETGQNEGYSPEAIWKQAKHGAGMGVLIGWVGPVAGNVFDPMVKSATSTGGKIALRGGEQASSALFEGTIFAAPDYISMRSMSDEDFDKQYARKYGYASLTDPVAKAKARSAARSSVGWDIWNDSMAMMLGFKAQHGIKSAWRTVREMAPYDAETLGRPLTMREIAHNRQSFQEKLRTALDKSPGDIAMTKEELEELRNAGYGKLASLFRKSDSTVKEVGPDGVERVVGEVEQVEIKYGPDEETVEGVKKSDFDGYDTMARLMSDNNVSEAARAKAYFILTGRRLPESTIMGYRTVEDENGNLYVQSLSGQGSVVTNRRFASKEKAQQEITNLQRQIELNSIEIGERFKAKEILSNATQAACEDVAAAHGEGWTAEAVRKAYEQAVKDLADPEKAQSVGQASKDLVKEVEAAANNHVDDFKGDTPDAIRERINYISGVNLDDVIRKERDKRTDKEQTALEAYLKALYPEEARQGEAPDAVDPEEPAPSQGQATVQEAREAGYNMTDQGQREQAMRNIRYQEKRMEELFGRTDTDTMFEEELGTSDPAEIFDLLPQSRYDATERAAIVDYLKACQVGDAAVERMEDDARNAMDSENAFIDKVSHEDGFVRPATMKVDSRQVYIVGGNVVFSEDGSMINTAASDRVIYIYDPATDKVEQTAPEMLSSLGTATSVEETRAAAERTITEQHENDLRTIQGDMMAFNPGDSFVADVWGEGPTQNRVVGVDNDGMIIFETEGKKGQFGLMPDQLSAMVDGYKQEAFESEMRQQAEAAPVVDERAIVRTGEAPAAPVSIKYDQGDSFRVAVSGREETQQAAVVDREGETVTIWTPFPVTDRSEKGRTMSGYTTDIARADLDVIIVRDEQGKPVDYVAANPEAEPEAAPAETPAGPEEIVIREGITGTADALKESFTVERERIGNEWLDTQAVQDAMRTYAEGASTVEEVIERAKADSNDERTRQRLDTLLEFDSTRQKLQALLAVPKSEETPLATYTDRKGTRRDVFVESDTTDKDGVRKITFKRNLTKADGTHKEGISGYLVITEDMIDWGRTLNGIDAYGQPLSTEVDPEEAESMLDAWANAVTGARQDFRAKEIRIKGDVISARNSEGVAIFLKRDPLTEPTTETTTGNGQKAQVPAVEPMPMRTVKEKGETWEEPDYLATTPERTHSYIYNESGLSRQEANDHVAHMARTAKEAVSNHKKSAPKIGGSIARYQKEKADWENAGTELQRAVDFWEAVRAEQKKVTDAERRAAAEEAAAVPTTEESGEGSKRAEQAPSPVQRSKGDGTAGNTGDAGGDSKRPGNLPPQEAEHINYKLSDEIDENGHQFVLNSKGDLVFGYVTPETSLPEAPILLSEGVITNQATKAGYGLLHIEARHGAQIRNAGYCSVLDFIEEVAQNYEIIKEGRERDGIKTYMLQLTDKHNNTLMVELSGDGTYWNINTAGIFKTSYGANRKEVYNRHTTVKQSAETVEESPESAQGGTTDSARMNSSTISSDDKSNTLFSEKQEEVAKSSEAEALGAGNLPTTERMASMTYEEVAQTAADYDASIEERYDAMIEPLESEKAVLESKRRTPAEGKRLKAIDKEIADIERQQEEERLKVGKYFTEELRRRWKNGEHSMSREEMEQDLFMDEADKEKAETAAKIAAAEFEVNTEPTEAQKKAGNYKMGHVEIDGLQISIENPKGSMRRGKAPDGTPWETEMKNTYGYIKGTTGVDGDKIDIFLSDNPTDGDVYVVDQYNKDGSFDEHKVMYGFTSATEAEAAYLSNYSADWAKGRKVVVTGVTREEFKKWLDASDRKKKPFAEYKSVKPIEAQSTPAQAEAPAEPAEATEGYELDVYETKKGKKFHRVKFPRADKEVWKERLDIAKEQFGGTSVPGGYGFKDAETAKAFAEAILHPVSAEGLKERTDAMAAVEDFTDKVVNEDAVMDLPDDTAADLHIVDVLNPGMTEHSPKEAAANLAEALKKVSDTKLLELLKEHKDNKTVRSILTDEYNRRGGVSPEAVETARKKPATRKKAAPKQKLEPEPAQAKAEPQPEAEKKARSKWFNEEDQDEAADLIRKMKARLRGGNLYSGIPVDVELLELGCRLGYLIMKKGARKLHEYAQAMIENVGDGIRPYIKQFYNATLATEEALAAEWYKDATPMAEIAKFDMVNFLKEQKPDVVETARGVTAEQEVQAALPQAATDMVKKSRDKMAIPGYFKPDGSVSAEQKAAQAGADLAAALVDELGLDLKNLPEGVQVITTNFGESGGGIKINLPIRAGYEPIKIDIDFGKTEEGALRLKELTTTVKRGDDLSYVIGEDHQAWLVAPGHKELFNAIRGQMEKYLPKAKPGAKPEGKKPAPQPSLFDEPETPEAPAAPAPQAKTGDKLLTQYEEMKKKHPDAVVLFRVGDFYETFHDDARIISETLGLTLTSRADKTPLAGFPHHALDAYLPKLVRAGKRVAICEQLEDPKLTKQTVKRGTTPQPATEPKAPATTQAEFDELSKKEFEVDPQVEKEVIADRNGFKIGDTVEWSIPGQGKTSATIIDVDRDGRPILDTGMAPIISSIAEWKDLTHKDGEGSQAPAPQRPKKELAGDSAKEQDRRNVEHDFVEAVSNELIQRINNEGSPLTMAEVRKMAEERGMKDVSPTDLQELVERAVSLRARSIAEHTLTGGPGTQEIGFNKIVKLYTTQPVLSDRDVERIQRQQYSTPVPMGYLMDQFMMSHGHQGKRLLEPSAGNGALTIGVPKDNCHVNDIDPRRLANLRAMGFKVITNQDALQPFEGQYDMVVTNPPFGTAPSVRTYDGLFEISTLEGQMAINALDSMTDDGRAAIIVGGSIGKWPTPYEKNGRLQKVADRQFFGYLYSHYNVVDIIPIDGKSLYSRNGTSYNVRMILIDGRRRDAEGNVIREVNAENRVFPPVKEEARPEAVTTYDELYKRVQDDILRIQQRLDVAARNDGGHVEGDGAVNPSDVPVANPTGDRGGERPVGTGDRSRTPRSGLGGTAVGSTGTRPGTDERPAGDRKPSGSTHGDTGGTDRRPVDEGPKPEGSRGSAPAGRPADTDGGTERHNPDGARQRGGSGPERLNQPKPVKVELTDEKVASPHVSSSNQLQSRMPAAQALEFERALHSIEEKHGNVDEWLTQELGYADTADLYRALAAEQVEGVAMAIDKMNSGRGFIIADQTGIGKGRQAASIIRYAVRNGHKPIFVTQKSGLFSDMYRDLCDVGSPELRPFIFGSSNDANITMRQEDGTDKIVYRRPSAAETERVYSYIEKHGTLPDEYDYAVTTYSQVQNGTTQYEIGDNGKIEAKPKKYKGKVPAGDITGERRRHVIDLLSRGNYLILDEAHTAGGQSGLGGYMQNIIPGVKGITYLSATYAKRPDNMPLYAIKTAISDSGVEVAELINAVAQGGVPLQEIMSRQLVKSGEMARRERDFTGVSIDWIPTDEGVAREQQKRFDTVSEIFVDIMRFQDTYVRPYLNEMSKDLARVGSSSGQKKGTKDMGIGNAPFASKLYNLLQQLLFSIKVDAVADRAIKNLQNGRKPIISFVNTMEGFLEEASIGMTEDGSASMPTLSLALRKALDGVMRYTVKDDNNNETHSALAASQLGPDAERAYNAIIEKMNSVSDDLPIAPLDAIRLKIEAAGYKVGELSGRKLELAKNDKGLYVIRNRKAADKKATASDFNAGKIDVLMVNKTGSTGISLHASSKFEDQRQRVMIAAQFQPDVNDEVQMRGRNDRTGQVVRGAYEYLLSSIPAEQRLQMMFKAKLKSLDANTTSSQKSSFNEMEVVDVLNKYGDAIVWDYLNEDPMGLNMDMGNPLRIDPNADVETQQQEAAKKSRNNDDEDGSHSGFARKALGRLALLSIAEQERVMSEITDRYEKKIHELDERGENDLEISYRDLKAKTLGRKVWVEGKAPGSGNAFADNVYMEQVEVNILDKPLSGTELAKYHRTFLEDAGVETWDEWLEKKTAEIDAFYENRIATVRERITTNKEATIARRIERFITTAKDARALGKNSFTDEEIIAEANRRYGETERQEAKAEIERETEKIRVQQNLIKRRLTQFKPMSPLSIPDDLTDESKMKLEPSTGVMVGIKLDSKYSLNGSSVVFAPLDGRRTITLSLKEAGVAFSKIGQASMMMRDVLRNFDLSQWDSHISNESRETRYMLTGNILRALVDMQKTQNARGRITAYTTEDGEVRTGILMSPKFTPGDLQSSVPLSSMLSRIQAGQEVKSSNGEVTVRKAQGWSSRGDYEILVPKSKQHGGKYFLPEQDPVLARYVVGGFNMPRSGSQAIGYIRAENLARVLDHLSTKHGASVMLSSKLKEASQDGIEYRTPEEGIEYVNARAIQPWSAPLDHLRFKRDELGYSLSLSERQQVRDLGAQEKAWEEKWGAGHTDTDVPTGRRSRFEFYADQYGQGGLSSEIYHTKREIGSLYDSNYRLISANARDMGRRAIPAIMRRRADLLAERPSFSRAGQAAIDAELADLEYMALYYQRMEAGEDVERTMPGRLEHQRMLATAREVAESLGEKVVLYEAPGDIHDSDYNRQVRKQRSYGWYNPNDGTIHINVGRHRNAREIVKTVLHEIVGHKTIEEIMGPKRFARLIDEIWNHAGKKLRAKIAEKMRKNGWDFREATKEYLGEIAEEVHTKGYETLEAEKKTIWQRVKAKIQDFLNRILEGLKIPARIRLTENDLSYMMWKLYKHKERKAAGKPAEGDIFDKAEEIVRREEWERDGESLEIAARSEDALPKRERIEKLRRSDPAIITGDEIEISDNLPQTRKNVIEYGKTLQGEYVNADTGDMIQLQKGRRNGGIKELLQHDMYDEEHIQSIAALPQIIEKGIYIDRAPNNDKTKNPTVEEYQHYVCGLKIGNEDYTVHSIVAVDVNGNRYYDHKLSHIEKGRLLDFIEAKQPIEQILAPLPSTQSKGAAPLTIRSERKVNELISLLQVEDERDTEMRYTSPAQESGLHFRDGDDMQNMTIEEQTLKLAVMLADRHSGDVAVRDAAVEALGKTLGNIRKAMAVQHTYDFNTVRSLGAVADILISSGTFLPEGPGEVKRLYGIMKRGIGHAYTDDAGVEHVTQSEKDYNAAVESLMDLFVSNQLKLSGKFLDEVMKIRGSKVNARGVEVIGDLDVEGQIMVRGMKDYMNMDVQAIHDRIDTLDDIIANGNDAASMNAAAEKMGLELAEQYVAEVSDRVAQEKVMRDQLRDMSSQWDPSMSGDARKAYTEQKRALRESIRKIRIERADAMRQLASQVGNELRNSIERVKAFREREKQRIEEIWHNANSDMAGRAFDEHGMKKKGLGVKLSNNMVSRLFLAPAATFEQIMRVFGSKSVDGEGYLFDRYVRGWQECRDKEWTSTQEVEGILDKKAAEILGKRKTRWSDLYALTNKAAGSCEWWDGGQIREHKVTQGNIMYMYMVNKMTDGQVKLRRMCITDDKMLEIEHALDSRLKAVADWLQEELLPNLRNKYNEVHMRMFGAPMAEIENYFPLRILANARLEEVEMAGRIDGKDLPKTMTGAIIKRRFNNYALDVLNSDAVSVALDHIREMETWAAFAEYRRDLCTLLSYKHFRNQVKNMSTIYGSGEKFWDKFYDLSLLVGGAYRPKDVDDTERALVNLTKLATGACIAIRLNTALKQLLSYPAFAPDANLARLMYNVTPWRARTCWKWAMKNMPSFQRRWKSRQAGNDVLRSWKYDWDWTNSEFVQKVQRFGITPNAFIDALTVAMGSEAVYQSKLKGYLKDGFSKEEAHRRAIMDAEIIFNLSQQSSELPYLSLLQNKRSYITTCLTNFRNSPMSYLRQSIQSKRELANMVKGKDVQIEFETKKGVREGLTPEQAKARAERKYKRNWVRNLFKSTTFDYILPALWAFGLSGMWYCIFGNDDEKKKQYAEDAMKRGLLGGFEGMTSGGTLPDFFYGLANGDKPQLKEETSPGAGLLFETVNMFSNGKTERAANEMINTMIALGVGVNPQVLEDGIVAGMDFFGEDEKSARDWALLFMRVLSCQQSQMDQVYFDELGMDAREASRKSPAELAERYATYKARRANFATMWAYDDNRWETEIKGSWRKKFEKEAKTRLHGQSDEHVNESLEGYDAEWSQTGKRLKALSNTPGDAVTRAAQAQAIFNSPEGTRYKLYNDMHPYLDQMIKSWLSAPTAQQAATEATAIIEYKAKLVEMLDAWDNPEKSRAAGREAMAIVKEWHNRQNPKK